MMRVKVRLVGHLARRLGRELEAEVTDGATLGGAVEEIFRKYGLGEIDVHSRGSAHGMVTVLLNGRNQGFDAPVREGDQIALIPPLVGG